MITSISKKSGLFISMEDGFLVAGMIVANFESKFIGVNGVSNKTWSGMQQGKDGYPAYFGEEEIYYLIAGGNDNHIYFEPHTLEFYGFEI